MKNHLTLFILIGLFFNACPIKSSENRILFRQFQYTDQLPSNSVQNIYKDKEGYMWFGTRDGLCRFDGYRIKIFRSNTANHNKLTNNNIRCMVEDNQHCLWIGTNEGINILDKITYSVTPFNHPTIGRDRITDICLDTKGNVWIATSTRGIVRIDPDRKSHVYQNGPSKSKIPSNKTITIYPDSKGNIWATFWTGGLAVYQPEQDNFKAFPPVGKDNNPFKILEDRNHDYWVCTWGDGIFAMNPDDKTGHPFTPVTFLKNSKPVKMNNIIYRMIQDSEKGRIWIVSFSGLDVLEKVNRTTFNVVTTESMFKDSSNKLFHEILDDKSGNLWLGSVGDGIFKLDFRNNNFQTNDLGILTQRLGFPPNVYHVCKAGNNTIYLVIDRLGVFCLDTKTQVLSQVSIPFLSGKENVQVMCYIRNQHAVWFAKENENVIYIVNDQAKGTQNNVKTIKIDPDNHSTINCLYEDFYGNVWIGFEQGLYRRSPDGKVTLISSNITNIVSLSGDRSGNIWIGTEKQGAFRVQYNDATRSLARIANFSEKAGNLQSNSIQTVCCDKTGNVYLGTREGSIYLYNQPTGKIEDISYKYGITEDAILDIIEDNYGLIWVSTIKKIIRYNPVNHVSMYYTSTDGILVSSFSKNASVKLENGQILFGGNKGFCLFTPTPANLHSVSAAQVKITDIDVNDQSIFNSNPNSGFDFKNNELILEPNAGNISLEFSSLNYSFADKIQYAYRLIGVDKDWVYPGSSRRYVNYASLPAGKYTFEVKATDENGQWSTRISSLKIIKKPPFYLTGWAYLLYAIVIAGIIWFLINRVRLRNELKISRIEKEKSEELAKTKLHYFTNISHDLLTPLSIIALLVEEIETKLTVADRPKAELVKSNVNRLKRLIRQILAFRRIETGNMKLKVQEADIVSFVREICFSNFQPLISENQINFIIKSAHENYKAWFDKDKLDKILYNLLSNAFKFTPDQGTIRIDLEFPQKESVTYLSLSVSDTGVGISDKDLPHIFSRFYISNASDQSKSNGIGLSLVKELSEIHNGEVSVTSELNKGTTFRLLIPISPEAYLPEEMSYDNLTEQNPNPELEQEAVSAVQLTDKSAVKRSDYSILIVEDNKELNQIMVAHFDPFFTVFSTNNGLDALNIIRENTIDLVISDVMMPVMDGLELCQTIKNDVAISHIAVLLLTAKISSDDQIEYFNAGADAYMPKPFDLKVLDARVDNLIQRREKSVSYFKENRDLKELEVSSMNYGSLDEEFLKKAIEVVEANISDINLDPDKLADVMNSSRSTLYRKLKSLTGLSSGEFIRNIRLKHACRILLNNNDPIIEIAYSLGFNDPKYFSRIFKAEFNLSPREYREMYQQNTSGENGSE